MATSPWSLTFDDGAGSSEFMRFRKGAMATFFFPLIRKEDYQAFRRILGNDLPETFDAWANRIACAQ
jgi:hypothetical protein